MPWNPTAPRPGRATAPPPASNGGGGDVRVPLVALTIINRMRIASKRFGAKCQYVNRVLGRVEGRPEPEAHVGLIEEMIACSGLDLFVGQASDSVGYARPDPVGHARPPDTQPQHNTTTPTAHASFDSPLEMDSTTAHPLRPYYVPQPQDHSWASISSSAAAAPAASTSARLPKPSIPLPSPGLNHPNRYEPTSLFGQSEAPTAGTMLKAFVTSSLLTFTSTALVMPFEVGKTLAQVQWVPREGVEPTLRLDGNVFNQGNDEDALDVSHGSVTQRGGPYGSVPSRIKRSRQSVDPRSLARRSKTTTTTTSLICHSQEPLPARPSRSRLIARSSRMRHHCARDQPGQD